MREEVTRRRRRTEPRIFPERELDMVLTKARREFRRWHQHWATCTECQQQQMCDAGDRLGLSLRWQLLAGLRHLDDFAGTTS